MMMELLFVSHLLQYILHNIEIIAIYCDGCLFNNNNFKLIKLSKQICPNHDYVQQNYDVISTFIFAL